MVSRRDVMLGTLASLGGVPVKAQPVNEPPSRGQLFETYLRQAAPPAKGPIPLAIPDIFRFPVDVRYDSILKKDRPPSIFGVDISGWTDSNVPLGDMRLQGVSFVYVKASQGVSFRDKKFSTFWNKLGMLSGNDWPWRGAYHFISSSNAGPAQADVFLSALEANGGLQPGDMAPALDLEWDVSNGVDQWVGRGKAYILDIVLGCLTRIKEKTGRIPALYTAKSWFGSQTIPLADFDKFQEFPLWVADYRPQRKLQENPDFPGSVPPVLWQFTDRAQLSSGFAPGLDASVFNGSEADFKKVFQIS